VNNAFVWCAVVISSVIKLTLVSGSQSSLFSTRSVLNNVSVLQFGDVFKVSIDQERLYSCIVQLEVDTVSDGREHCWVID